MAKETSSSYSKVAQLVDAGLRDYMRTVFAYMSGGLAITALVAYFASTSSDFMHFLFSSSLVFWIVALAPLGISLYLVGKISSIPVSTARTLFFVYSGVLGLSLSSIFLVYSHQSIATTFFVASSMFLGMVIYGYATERDLTNFGSFLFMGLIGLIIASIVNIFMKSGVASLVISAIGVVVFTGLTAFDAQVIKSYYLESDSSEISEKKAVLGALNLYLDFINLFLYLLRFLGSERR
ncbi:MAG: Bax inhibitor-1/YccA family protein [Alphaproteobacteria bacterium]|nr:Bax inhibitor-1/YccA family protein [Alphaproteobacteria bacterium]